MGTMGWWKKGNLCSSFGQGQYPVSKTRLLKASDTIKLGISMFDQKTSKNQKLKHWKFSSFCWSLCPGGGGLWLLLHRLRHRFSRPGESDTSGNYRLFRHLFLGDVSGEKHRLGVGGGFLRPETSDTIHDIHDYSTIVFSFNRNVMCIVEFFFPVVCSDWCPERNGVSELLLAACEAWPSTPSKSVWFST